MKILLTLFVLLFSSSVVAEDISDFEIEGISIGDSLLDYLSEEEIRNSIVEQYQHLNDQSFTTVELFQSPLLTNYNSIQINIKRNDKKYKIYAIYGAISYDYNFDQCLTKLDQISDEISSIFNNVQKEGPSKTKHSADPTGQSTYTGVYYWFMSDDYVGVQCYDWSDDLTKTKGWRDSLRVSVNSREFYNWLNQ